MSAYDPTRRPGGREPLEGAPAGDLSIDEELAEGEEERVLGERGDDEGLDEPHGSGEEEIDEHGRNPTQRAIEDDPKSDRPVA